MDQTRILPIVESLYGAALQRVEWTEALAGIGDAVRADHVILSTPPFLASAGVDTRQLARSAAAMADVAYDGPSIDPLPSGVAHLRSALMPDADYARTVHYNETIRPLGGFHGMFAKVEALPAGPMLVICRNATRTDFDRMHARSINLLLPHLRMAIDIGQRTAQVGVATAAFETLLENIGESAMICNRSHRPLFANADARRLLAERDGLDVGISGLLGATAEDTRRLRDALALAERHGATRLRLSRPSGRPHLMLRLVPAGCLGGGAPSGAMVVFVSQPDAAREIDREAVAEAFGLTRREVEIAALLATGSGPSAIALRLGLGVDSVRTYLKRIFGKTGASTQASLVAMIRGFE
ncbi:helix-turn-helix transcriptional regulator [Mesorhizobium sp. LHD-90]|uniref:helix-turn-helix transcriptional regulator n=1 Tax=Mesorhizobium sp. LHD-90 TaxID=3071414 RepID=UPI0027DF2F14|nr:helix-turn-helix transcriptional regulator [Mesorhizobium sp. LHD-90]MDQ6433015.1 helix-turn-helix transcriptional regulator [Mesorhizobium sp. LHD-90]